MSAAKPAGGFRGAGRLKHVDVSEILSISRLAGELRSRGKDILNLGLGEPDFATPASALKAAAQAMNDGATRYTALDGTAELKLAIREKLKRDNALDYGPEEMIVSAGAKQVLFNAMFATLNEGDEVIVPAPCWGAYPGMVSLAGATPVVVPCSDEEGFHLTPANLELAITDRTRWVIFNSPSNPTGATYSTSDYEELLEVLHRHPDVWLVSDDVYEHIIYDGREFVNPVMVDERMRERTLVVNSVSKAYAMTGWRIGYGCGPKPLIRAMLNVQSQSTACPCSVSQAAAIAALTVRQDVLRKRCEIFQRRRDLVVGRLNGIEGIRCAVPQGAFYVFASCEGTIGLETPDGERIESDIDFAVYLLEQAGVVVVPGAPFGMPSFFRLSFAASEEELERACGRIAEACQRLSGRSG